VRSSGRHAWSVSRIRARLFDPQRPTWARVAAAAGAVALVLGTAWGSGAAAWLGLAVFLIAPLFHRRHAGREVELVLGHGLVRVRSFGPFGARIRGRRLVGASTAYLPDGRALLTLRGRRRTRTLELADAAAAQAVRDALGIGHYGVGTLRFDTVPTRTMLLGQALRAAGALAAIGATLGVPLAAFFAIVATLGVLVFTFAAANGQRPHLELVADGVIQRWPTCGIPYLGIAEISIAGGDLILLLEDGERVIVHGRSRDFGVDQGLGDDELATLHAQIVSAMSRARGLGAVEPSVAPSVAELGDDQAGLSAWLGKIDSMAARLASAGGYRGAPLSEAELWAALENHDAEPEVRAAAARVLVQSRPSSRPRIAAVAASARDHRTERRIRFALLSDPEDAERALAKLATS
jgi:hypothetical protein